MFSYPNNVGTLDRKDIEKLSDALYYEKIKASELFDKIYPTNQIED